MNKKVLNVIVFSSFLAAMVLLMNSCCCRSIDSRFGNGNNASLFDTEWKLVQLEGRNVKAGDTFRLEFSEEGKVAGVGSCNRFFGGVKFTSANGGIQMGPLGSTMMACPDLGMESIYFRMLESADTYTVFNGQLFLLKNSELIGLFDAASK